MSTSFGFQSFRLPLSKIAEIERCADSDPIGLLTRCNQRAKALARGMRILRWELLIGSYAGALGIVRHPEKFDDLLKHEFFEGRVYKSKIEDVLRLSILIGTDSEPRGTSYKSKLRDIGILQPHFDQRVEPSVLMQKIKAARGLNRLNGDNKKTKVGDEEAKIDESPATDPVEDGFSDHSPQDQHQDDADLGEMEVLQVHLPRRDLLRLLDSPIGTCAEIVLEHVASKSARKRMEAYGFRLSTD